MPLFITRDTSTPQVVLCFNDIDFVVSQIILSSLISSSFFRIFFQHSLYFSLLATFSLPSPPLPFSFATPLLFYTFLNAYIPKLLLSAPTHPFLSFNLSFRHSAIPPFRHLPLGLHPLFHTQTHTTASPLSLFPSSHARPVTPFLLTLVSLPCVPTINPPTVAFALPSPRFPLP